RRTIDSFPPAHSPRYLRGFDRLAASFPARHVLCSSRRRKKNTRRSFDLRVLCSGDVLLSHGLSPYYHRGCSVSLPCSEWERVGPLRYCHQRSEPDWRFRRFAPTRISGDDVDLLKNFGSLISTYRK